MLSRSWGDRQAAALTGGLVMTKVPSANFGPLWKPQALGAPLAGPLKRSVGWPQSARLTWSAICVQEEPLGRPAAAEDFSKRPAFHVLAGRKLSAGARCLMETPRNGPCPVLWLAG